MSDDVLAPGDVEWRRSDGRIYGITEVRGLFEPHALLIAWGRKGRLRRRVETFATLGELEARRRELAGRRRRNGYAPTAISDTRPLRTADPCR